MPSQIYLRNEELLTTSIELNNCDYYDDYEGEFEFKEVFNLLNLRSFTSMTDFDYHYKMSTTEFTFDSINDLEIIIRNHIFVDCGVFSYDVTNVIAEINDKKYYVKNMETLKYLIDDYKNIKVIIDE